MQQKGYLIPDEITDFIAQNIKENIRELEGALNSVIGQSKIRGRVLNLSDVEEILKRKIKPVKVVTADNVIKIIANYYNIEEKKINEKNKTARNCQTKANSDVYFKKRLKYSLSLHRPEVGAKRPYHRHSRLQKNNLRYKNDKKLEQEINNIRDIILKS